MEKAKKIIFAIPNSGSQSFKKVINNYTDYKCRKIRAHEIDFYNFLTNISLALIKIVIKLFLKFDKFYFNADLLETLINFISSKEYKYLGLFHSDSFIGNIKLFNKYDNFLQNNNNNIFKQHFSPTDLNKEFFKNYKKVLLLRETSGVLNKFKFKLNNVNSPTYKFLLEKVTKDVDKWKENWSNEPNILILNFEDLVKDPINNLNRVEDFLDIKFNLPSNFNYPVINKSK